MRVLALLRDPAEGYRARELWSQLRSEQDEVRFVIPGSTSASEVSGLADGKASRVSARRARRELSSYVPDTVVFSLPVDPFQRWLGVARSAGIPTVGFSTAWDTGEQGRSQECPDWVLAWNQMQKTELLLYLNIAPHRVLITGPLALDAEMRTAAGRVRRGSGTTGEELPDVLRVTYCMSSPAEERLVRSWVRNATMAEAGLDGVSITIGDVTGRCADSVKKVARQAGPALVAALDADLSRVVSEADAVVTLDGGTALRALLSGKPTFAVVTPALMEQAGSVLRLDHVARSVFGQVWIQTSANLEDLAARVRRLVEKGELPVLTSQVRDFLFPLSQASSPSAQFREAVQRASSLGMSTSPTRAGFFRVISILLRGVSWIYGTIGKALEESLLRSLGRRIRRMVPYGRKRATRMLRKDIPHEIRRARSSGIVAFREVKGLWRKTRRLKAKTRYLLRKTLPRAIRRMWRSAMSSSRLRIHRGRKGVRRAVSVGLAMPGRRLVAARRWTVDCVIGPIRTVRSRGRMSLHRLRKRLRSAARIVLRRVLKIGRFMASWVRMLWRDQRDVSG